MVPRHTWSTSSMPWASAFASGASTLGRSRRLAVHPDDLGRPRSRGKFGENSPHFLGNIEKGSSRRIFHGTLADPNHQGEPPGVVNGRELTRPTRRQKPTAWS